MNLAYLVKQTACPFFCSVLTGDLVQGRPPSPIAIFYCFVHHVTKLQGLTFIINISMFELFYCQDKWPLHLLMWVRIKRLVQGHRASDRAGACLQALNLQLRDDSTTFSPLCLLCSHNKRRRSHFWNTVDRILGYLFNLLQSTHHCRN